MSMFVLIISLLALYFSVISMKNWFKSNNKLQEEFTKSYNKIKEEASEEVYNWTIILFSIFYTGLWINFYVVAFNVFKSEWLSLSLIAVFYLLQSIYNFFKGLIMFAQKEVKSSVVNKVLNTIELVYVVYFIYYYVFHWSVVLR